MSTPRQSRPLLIVAGAVLLLCLCSVVAVLAVYSLFGPRMMGWGRDFRAFPRDRRAPFNMPWGGFDRRADGDFESNGERIYFTATSESGEPIVADLDGGHMFPEDSLACVDCHGPEGRGGEIRMMMGTITVPEITPEHLAEHDPPFTEETLKRAITEGIAPDGDPLEWPMPRWSMSESDLDDLVDFLQTLE